MSFRVGLTGAKQDIVLNGTEIQTEHCEFQNEDGQ